MAKFEIYRNYGVLGAEKKNVYTYGAEHINAVCSDRITVELPENEFFELYENVAGFLMVEASWGACYQLNDLLYEKEDKPYLRAIREDKPTCIVALVEIN